MSLILACHSLHMPLCRIPITGATVWKPDSGCVKSRGKKEHWVYVVGHQCQKWYALILYIRTWWELGNLVHFLQVSIWNFPTDMETYYALCCIYLLKGQYRALWCALSTGRVLHFIFCTLRRQHRETLNRCWKPSQWLHLIVASCNELTCPRHVCESLKGKSKILLYSETIEILNYTLLKLQTDK